MHAETVTTTKKWKNITNINMTGNKNEYNIVILSHLYLCINPRLNYILFELILKKSFYRKHMFSNYLKF